MKGNANLKSAADLISLDKGARKKKAPSPTSSDPVNSGRNETDSTTDDDDGKEDQRAEWVDVERSRPRKAEDQPSSAAAAQPPRSSIPGLNLAVDSLKIEDGVASAGPPPPPGLTKQRGAEEDFPALPGGSSSSVQASRAAANDGEPLSSVVVKAARRKEEEEEEDARGRKTAAAKRGEGISPEDFPTLGAASKKISANFRWVGRQNAVAFGASVNMCV